MPKTGDYNEAVVARVKRDRKFARALYGEVVSVLIEGDTTEGRNSVEKIRQ